MPTKPTAPSLQKNQIALLRAAGAHRREVTAALWPAAVDAADRLATDPPALSRVPARWVEHVLALCTPAVAVRAAHADGRPAATHALTALGLDADPALLRDAVDADLADCDDADAFLGVLARFVRRLPTRLPGDDFADSCAALCSDAAADHWGVGAHAAHIYGLLGSSPPWLAARVLATCPAWDAAAVELFTPLATTPHVFTVAAAGVPTLTPAGAAALDAFAATVAPAAAPADAARPYRGDPAVPREFAYLFARLTAAVHRGHADACTADAEAFLRLAVGAHWGMSYARQSEAFLAAATFLASNTELAGPAVPAMMTWHVARTPAGPARRCLDTLARRNPSVRPVLAAACRAEAPLLDVWEQAASDDELARYVGVFSAAGMVNEAHRHFLRCADQSGALTRPRLAAALVRSVGGLGYRSLLGSPKWVGAPLRSLAVGVLADELGTADPTAWQLAFDLLGDGGTSVADAARAARAVAG